jgi:hypothetical protein
MQFQCLDDVAQPAQKVFELLRDHQHDLIPYLNDVDEISVLERKDLDGGKVNIINLWRGSNAKAPSMIQKFLSPDLLSWKDHALWHSEPPLRAEWRLEPKIGGTLFECDGVTTIEPNGDDACRIRVDGNLRIYPERMPGVPKFLAGRLKSKVEAFVVKLLVPNMQTMALGVDAYFEDKASGRLETQS